jgi:hypothetical protein
MSRRPKMMTEAEAWLILAEEFEAERTGTGFLCLALGKYGVLWENERIAAIPSELRRAMIHRIEAAMESPYSVAYDSEYDPEHRDARVTACLLFSAIAADEQKAAA